MCPATVSAEFWPIESPADGGTPLAKKRDNRKSDDKARNGDKAFDIDDPHLPKWIKEAALTSDHYPCDKKLDRKSYEADLEALQIELGKLQADTLQTGRRIVALFEGRDSAGKSGGCIKRFMEHLIPNELIHDAFLDPRI
jgi:polyphosphate kinase 2 (PPK2 family)